LAELSVDSATASLKMVKSALDNQPGAALDIVLLNAGAAIYAANIADSLADGIATARQAVASGAARAKLEALINYSKTLSHEAL
jgi:anthranilate phosphoribosyltransferase